MQQSSMDGPNPEPDGPRMPAGSPESVATPRAEPGAEPQDAPSGPGLERHDRADKVLITAWVFALAGFLPVTPFESILGYGYFGPIAWPAILSMVGILFAVIAGLRALDWQDKRMALMAGGAFLLGFLRLFVVPFF